MDILHIYLCVILASLCSAIVIEDLVADPVKRSEYFRRADGSKYQDDYYAEKGVEGGKGYKQEKNYEEGLKGQHGNERHVTSYEEDEGKKKKDYDEGNRESSHFLEGGSHRGGNHRDKKGHKRGQKMIGFHNKYFKDELHKHDRFYDDYHKEGSHSKFGNYRAGFSNDEAAEKKGGSHNKGFFRNQSGKKGGHSKGHFDEDSKGRKSHRGQESRYSKGVSHGRKGGHRGGKEYAYSQKY